MQMHDERANPTAPGSGPGLVLLYAPQFERFAPAYPLGEHGLIVGRDPASGLCAPSGTVSRQHARIHQQDDRWVLTDLGGRNGTIINGAFVRDVPLEHNDEIRIGDAIFKFVSADAEGYARYRIDGAFVESRAADGSPGEARPRPSAGRIIGGYQVHRLASALWAVAKSSLSVVILGESGTGKEVFAQQLHEWSGRRGPFQAINCAAIPAPLLEGELFGHKRGVFSGADRDRTGLIRAADGGTLFLDEIGDMPLEAQVKLLRVLQTREVFPIGATQPERVDIRVVCATHRDLPALQRSGGFRGDLFARLNEYAITLPPLRERKEDIFVLCQALAARHGKAELRVTFPFMTGLLHYDFPFNVRELEALIKRGVALGGGDTLELDVQHFSTEIQDNMRAYARRDLTSPELASRPPLDAPPPEPRGRMPDEQKLRALLAEHAGNIAAVGRVLGKDRTQVHRWIKRYGINLEEYR